MIARPNQIDQAFEAFLKSRRTQVYDEADLRAAFRAAIDYCLRVVGDLSVGYAYDASKFADASTASQGDVGAGMIYGMREGYATACADMRYSILDEEDC